MSSTANEAMIVREAFEARVMAMQVRLWSSMTPMREYGFAFELLGFAKPRNHSPKKLARFKHGLTRLTLDRFPITIK